MPRDRAACADPEARALVDAAYDRPGANASRELRARYCHRCPVAGQCLAEAMLNGERGVWGATSPKSRTEHGGAPIRSAAGNALFARRYQPVTT